MGRASRKGGGGGGGLRDHWTKTHPDRHLWTEAQRIHAEMQTREEYEALYGRGSGILLEWSEGEDRLFLVQPEPSAFVSPKDLEDYRGEPLPLLRALADGSFHLQGHQPGAIRPLDHNHVVALLRVLEEELGPADYSSESWSAAEMGSADWSGRGFGTEPLEHKLEGPAEIRAYISGWIQKMEVGEAIYLEREGAFFIRRTEDGYLLDITAGVNSEDGSVLKYTNSQDLEDHLVDVMQQKNFSPYGEWKIGDRTLFGRHEDAFLYIGGPVSIMMIDISSEEPRGGQIQSSCQMCFEDLRLHLHSEGPLSRAEAVLLRNVLASLAQDSELFDESVL